MNSIIRFSQKLAAKIHETDLQPAPAAQNPYLDWHAHLFTARRAQYIIMSNSNSLFSAVIHGAGITHFNAFLNSMSDMLKEILHELNTGMIYQRIIAPGFANIKIAKKQDKKVIGAMNDMIFFAKLVLNEEEISPYDLSLKLNNYMIRIQGEHGVPRKVFLGMKMEER